MIRVMYFEIELWLSRQGESISNVSLNISDSVICNI